MLSNHDINKELGRGINIFPFKAENIKENSINLSCSEFAWTMAEGKVFLKEDGEFYNPNEVKKEKKNWALKCPAQTPVKYRL